ncbi:MAG: CoA pyrophosphatase [Elusimicrobia bacterium]|nr:CoA pyrophosphatase [Elusimicrobiota bacterium]
MRELSSPSLERLRLALRSRKPRRSALRGFTRAATLVPVAERPGGLSLVFTARSAGLSCHAGQISFPGGRREACDRRMRDTALREAREEVGLDPAAVEVVGVLDDVATYTGFVITPVVGWIGKARGFAPDRREVRRVLELPLARLADPGGFSHAGFRDVAGAPHPMFEFRVGKVLVWGATARMVHDLLSILGWPKKLRL